MLSALEYFETKKRMVNATENGSCSILCYNWPLVGSNNGHNISCLTLEITKPEDAIKIVEEWGKANPTKTILDDFWEKYPNAPKSDDGTLKSICPNFLGYTHVNVDLYCDEDCIKCWNKPLNP